MVAGVGRIPSSLLGVPERPVDPHAYDELPDGVLVADADGAVVAVNPAAERLLGLPADMALGRDYRTVLPLCDAAGRDWWALTTPYQGLGTRVRQPERQLRYTGPDGGIRELLVTAAYVRDSAGAGALRRLVVCLRDTTVRERDERGRADLVSTVAHELRSPLTSVKGFTATLLTKWDRFTDEQKKLMLETVNADADRVTRLITELLDVSRIDAGRLELRRQVVDLSAAVQKVFDGRVAAGEPASRFVLEATGTPPEMWVDPDKLAQILGNLVENAIRHGDGTVRVRVEPATVGGGPGAAITVTDEGPGVPPDLAPRIFGRFWRDRRRGGTGLGLYITKGLVEAHGGSIVVGAAPGGGALFRFTLPAATPAFAQ